MQFSYGPVPSRRLGRSVGIDLIPNKTCNYSCIYCQLGRTTCFTNERSSFFPREAIWADVAARLGAIDLDRVDIVTFVGNGEPCLSRDLGWCLRRVKAEYGLTVAVITNGSLLHDPAVREDLLDADVVLPTCDAGTEKTFRRVNRPHPGLSLDVTTKGMQAFREQYAGQLWLEVMLVGGVNDGPEELDAIAASVRSIAPDKIFVNVPVRPPAEPWVHVPSLDRMDAARAVFPGATFINFLEHGEVTLPGTTIEAIHGQLVELVKRHPLREHQLLDIIAAKGFDDPPAALASLLGRGSLQATPYEGQAYIQFVPGP